MKPTKVRISDACEVAFQGFALDVQDNGAGLWDGEQDGEATRALLRWAGWLGEDGEVLDEVPFPYALLVPADASAEMIERVAAVVREESDAEGEHANENDDPEMSFHAGRASDFLFKLARSLDVLAVKRARAAQKKALKVYPRVVRTHYTGKTLTFFVVGWRECKCGAKIAEMVTENDRSYANLRCTRTGGSVGALICEGQHRGEVLNAKPCDADPDADWMHLLAEVHHVGL